MNVEELACRTQPVFISRSPRVTSR